MCINARSGVVLVIFNFCKSPQNKINYWGKKQTVVKKSSGKILIGETFTHQRGFYGKNSLKIKILKHFVGEKAII